MVRDIIVRPMAGKTHRQSLGDHFSEGARVLWVSMGREKLSQEGLRRRLNEHRDADRPMARGVINRWLYGDRKPDGEGRGMLFKSLGIDPSLWECEPRKPFAPPKAA